MSIKEPIPEIDLSHSDAIQTQKRNIELFKVKQKRVIGGFIATFAIAIFGHHFHDLIQIGGVIVILAITMFFTMISMFLYKCPHCGTSPSGVAYSIGYGTTSYSKGIHPFPKRCLCCGYYLNTKSLEKDIQASNHGETSI